VELKLYKREVLGLVGESGCGKSVTALTTIGLLPENAYVLDGDVLFKGENLLEKSKEEMRILRAKEFATVFQDPMTFLNPVLTMETQLEEVFMLDIKALSQAVIKQKSLGKNIGYSDFLSLKESGRSSASDTKVSKAEIRKIAKELYIDVLRVVKLPDPERILHQYPFELSGGMRQRCMIAMALARRPSVFLADEITTALDVTIQAKILHLMRIAVMYGGNTVEVASTREIFKASLHPYTKMLMRAIPNVANPVDRLESIPGTVPEMINPPTGCRFHPRCPSAMGKCSTEAPKLKEVVKNHEVACYLY